MLAAAQMHPVNLLTTFVWPGLALPFFFLPFPSLLFSFPFLFWWGAKKDRQKLTHLDKIDPF